jgi:hypothetical protein
VAVLLAASVASGQVLQSRGHGPRSGPLWRGLDPLECDWSEILSCGVDRVVGNSGIKVDRFVCAG